MRIRISYDDLANLGIAIAVGSLLLLLTVALLGATVWVAIWFTRQIGAL